MENKNIRAKYINNAIAVTELLKTGIEDENGNVRDFDIIDYYSMSKTAPERLFEIAGKAVKSLYDKEQYEKFSKFCLKHGTSAKITIKEIMGIKHSVFDNGVVREITEEEKLEAIRFLAENNIKLGSDVYFAAIKRELNDTLYFDEKKENVEKVKTLKK